MEAWCFSMSNSTSKFSIRANSSHNQSIGLLGGSFNPPHSGHLQISVEAMKKLNLQQIVWLVTPQNPHKQIKHYLTIAKRVEMAKEITRKYNYISISDIESKLRSRYTYDTVTHLNSIHPNTKFIWIMGADNIPLMHKWYRWHELLSIIEFAVFDREPYSYAIDTSRLSAYCAKLHFFRIRRDPTSSTMIRSMATNFL